ncbi:MAG: hypothetical protein BWZ02_00141 [Lentisphaerae bacterium ADurb.BinA184]|nr:MAG: hypothetical protein BWZ02_00141 [Lentisphaerae bacterium ADurb.BinA184]
MNHNEETERTKSLGGKGLPPHVRLGAVETNGFPSGS